MYYNVLQYLQESCKKNPQKIFAKTPLDQITFASLYKKVKEESNYIRSKFKIRHFPILVGATRSIQSIVDMLAVAMSGNFYIPVNLSQPDYRIKQYIDVSKSKLFFVDNKNFGRYINFSQEIEIINTECLDFCCCNDQAQYLDEIDICPYDILYGMFTSGSTGVPKLVINTHGNVITFIEAFTDIFNIRSDNSFGNHATFDFDISVKDIYLSLKNSCTLHIFPQNFVIFPVKLINYINDNDIDTAIWSVPILKFIYKYHIFEQGIVPTKLKKIYFSGEEMPTVVLNYFKEYLPNTEFCNLYGPTEITCNCSYYNIDREFNNDEQLPIGNAFPHCELIILNDDNKRVEEGEIGEIYVRSTSLSLGYYNDAEKTNSVFVQNPLNTSYRDIVYKTGDIGKYNSKNEIVFIGRKDTQVKYNGHRIELSEIELCARQLREVDDVCCMFDKFKEDIVIIYSGKNECNKLILSHIRSKLPNWMVPKRIYYMKELPTNERLKIDRMKLKKIYNIIN